MPVIHGLCPFVPLCLCAFTWLNVKIQFIGHCTFCITLDDGRTLLTDPWFRNARLLRTVPTPFTPDDFPRVDFILCSHNHLDHVDVPSILLAKKTGAIVIGARCAAGRARRAGILESHGLKPNGHAQFDGLKITAAPAQHPFAPHAVGFLIEAEKKKLFFSGDTQNTPELQDFLSPHKIDMAFLQVLCARYFGVEDGMTDETAFQLAKLIKPDVSIPMHEHARFKHGSAERFCERMEKEKMPVRHLEIGQTIQA